MFPSLIIERPSFSDSVRPSIPRRQISLQSVAIEREVPPNALLNQYSLCPGNKHNFDTMGLFSRRSRDGPVANNGQSPSGYHHRRTGPSRNHAEPYSMTARPTFGQWLRHTWLDILTMVVMGAIGLGVSSASLLTFH